MITISLLEQIKDSLTRHYSLTVDAIGSLRDGGSRSYLISSGDRRFFVKAVPPAFMDTAKQSAEILSYLVEKGLPVPRMLLTKDGSAHFRLETEEGVYLCFLFDWIEGREPNPGEDIEKIGAVVGRLHSAMQSYTGQLTVHAKPFFIGRYLDILEQKGYPRAKVDSFREYGDLLWSRVENLPRGFCHGDLHRGNLLRTPTGKYYLLDFDTSCIAFPVYDIMVMCDSTNYFQFEFDGYHKSRRTYERFLEGYQEYRTLSGLESTAFFDLIAVRHYQLQATIIEINGLDCVDEEFLDRQLDWLMRWKAQCDKYRNQVQN